MHMYTVAALNYDSTQVKRSASQGAAIVHVGSLEALLNAMQLNSLVTTMFILLFHTNMAAIKQVHNAVEIFLLKCILCT